MLEVEQERQRCEQIIINAMKRNKDCPIVLSKLKLVLQKVRSTRSTGKRGGRSNVPQATPSDNSTNVNPNATN